MKTYPWKIYIDGQLVNATSTKEMALIQANAYGVHNGVNVVIKYEGGC